MPAEVIRVMLCDDSSTMRRLIKTALKAEPRLEVVFEASNGKLAVQNLDAANPDIVIMDVEMPVMDGIVATRRIKAVRPRLPILMFSSLTSKGAEATLDALAAGASDFALKPTASGHIQNALKQIKQDLIVKILKFAGRKRSTMETTSVAPQRQQVLRQGRRPQSQSKFSADVIAIGVSTGGPEALAEVLKGVPGNFPKPILITQHMPPVFTRLLAQRLSSQTGHKVIEAADGDIVQGGQVLLAPGDFHMTVRKSGSQVSIQLNQDRPENSCRPAVDPMFRSIASCYGGKTLGIVLTGMGRDGVNGSKAIKSQGGRVIVQDQASSVVWGMPEKVSAAGLADEIHSLSQIAQEIKNTCSLTKTTA